MASILENDRLWALVSLAVAAGVGVVVRVVDIAPDLAAHLEGAAVTLLVFSAGAGARSQRQKN